MNISTWTVNLFKSKHLKHQHALIDSLVPSDHVHTCSVTLCVCVISPPQQRCAVVVYYQVCVYVCLCISHLYQCLG